MPPIEIKSGSPNNTLRPKCPKSRLFDYKARFKVNLDARFNTPPRPWWLEQKTFDSTCLRFIDEEIGEKFSSIDRRISKLRIMELEKRKLIVHKHLENPSWSASKIAKVLKFPKSTVCLVIKRYKDNLSVDRAQRIYHKSGTRDKELRRKVLRCVKGNPGISIRELAKKCDSNFSTVRNILSREGYKSFCASKHPNRSLKQNSVAKKRARLLYERVLTKFDGCILMDDETYVKMDYKQIPGRKFYLATGRGDVPSRYKFVFADKFARKLMIWQGICSCGLNQGFHHIYYNEFEGLHCLKKRILPFIRQHKTNVMFWPDLASCHYSKEVLEWYAANNVNFVAKEINPPNCPEFRPIE